MNFCRRWWQRVRNWLAAFIYLGRIRSLGQDNWQLLQQLLIQKEQFFQDDQVRWQAQQLLHQDEQQALHQWQMGQEERWQDQYQWHQLQQERWRELEQWQKHQQKLWQLLDQALPSAESIPSQGPGQNQKSINDPWQQLAEGLDRLSHAQESFRQAMARDLNYLRSLSPPQPWHLSDQSTASMACVAYTDPVEPEIPVDLANQHLINAPYTLVYFVQPDNVLAALQVIDALYALRRNGYADLRLILCLLPGSRCPVAQEISMLTRQIRGLDLGDALLLRPMPDPAGLLDIYYQADLVIALNVTRRTEVLTRAAWHDRHVLIHLHPEPHPEMADLPPELLLLDSRADALAAAVVAHLADADLRRERLRVQRGFFVFPDEPPVDAPLRLRIDGPCDSSYSLAIVNRETAQALAGEDVAVSLYQTDGYGDSPPDPIFLAHNPDLAEMFRRSPVRVDVTLRNLYPPRSQAMPGYEKLLGPWGWEESLIPPRWIVAFNRRLTGVLCLSDYVRDTLLANGLRVPAITTGVPVGSLLTRQPEDCGFALPSGPFLLHVSSGMLRKGVDVLLAALQQLAGPVTLVIKSSPNPQNLIEEQLAVAGYLSMATVAPGVTAYAGELHKVLLIMNDLTDGQMHALYRQADVLVAPSRGEGFGLPLAEAMLLDLPVITTDYGGQADFCSEETAWLVPTRLVAARSHLSLPGSQWAEPDPSILAALIDSLLGIGPVERATRVQAARLRVQQSYAAPQVAARILNFVDRPQSSEQRTKAP